MIKLTQQTNIEPPIQTVANIEQPTSALTYKKESAPQISLQELIESMKNTADDVGQISELTSEEKLLVTEFFNSLLKLMQPLAPEISINVSILPGEIGNIANAHIDPTGHLVLIFADGHLELKNLNSDKNRDLLILIVQDIIPKFKQLTSLEKRKVENRIKFLSAITKEMQKIANTLSSAISKHE